MDEHHGNEHLSDWSRWIDTLDLEVSTLVESQYLHREMRAIIMSNSDLRTMPSAFHPWFFRNYVIAALVAVRRITDTRRDVRSLARLLRQVEKHAELLSRNFFRDRYGLDRKTSADAAFDRLVGSAENHLRAEKVRADRSELERVRASIKRFVDEKVAHLGRDHESVPKLDVNTLDEGIASIQTVFLDYYELIGGTRPDSLVPTYQHDWKAIFRIPWISPAVDCPTTIRRSS